MARVRLHLWTAWWFHIFSVSFSLCDLGNDMLDLNGLNVEITNGKKNRGICRRQKGDPGRDAERVVQGQCVG